MTVPFAQAADLTIFDARKPIAMSDKDKPAKDFYINGGNESGLRSGTILTVVRRIPLYDSYQNRSSGDLTVPVAKVIIIHVQPGLSVARFYSEISRLENPILEEPFIMIGDRLDLSTATKEKKDAESAPEPKKEPPATAQVTSELLEIKAGSSKAPPVNQTTENL